ncbi:MAG TPA: cob(I)yrinic acid a,c-diamide adenosyltransferase [Verrucomicrobiae bacterium]|nr:cob(I)yrinic acid a,c-diamide adenosyltransferase [Verrucomicrobiae bacterium]
MSIATKTGDGGTTGLMYGHRVPKNHPRVEACGTIDELNSAIGLARATATEKFVGENLFWIQKSLVDVMGEVGVPVDDLPRYVAGGFTLVKPELTAKLDALVKEIEAQQVSFKGWATPGATVNSAALDVARTVCRRAERRVYDLQSAGELKNGEILVFLNRLSDLLWLFARWVETQSDHVKK